jgi:hypothetical protein
MCMCMCRGTSTGTGMDMDMGMSIDMDVDKVTDMDMDNDMNMILKIEFRNADSGEKLSPTLVTFTVSPPQSATTSHGLFHLYPAILVP